MNNAANQTTVEKLVKLSLCLGIEFQEEKSYHQTIEKTIQIALNWLIPLSLNSHACMNGVYYILKKRRS